MQNGVINRSFRYEMIHKMIPEHIRKWCTTSRRPRRGQRGTGLLRMQPNRVMRMGKRRRKMALMALKQKPERESWQFDVDSTEEILQETDLESDVDDENAKDIRSKVEVHETKKFAGQRGKAWLKGRKEDASLDSLDPSVSRRVHATKPDLAKDTQSAEPIKHNFKTFPDRRLLISEMEEEEGKVKGKKNQGGKA